MKPVLLVYILSAIIIAFVVRGYYCAEEMKYALHSIQQGGDKAIDFNHMHTIIEEFKNHLILSGVLAVVIAVCCRLKAPK